MLPNTSMPTRQWHWWITHCHYTETKWLVGSGNKNGFFHKAFHFQQWNCSIFGSLKTDKSAWIFKIFLILSNTDLFYDRLKKFVSITSIFLSSKSQEFLFSPPHIMYLFLSFFLSFFLFPFYFSVVDKISRTASTNLHL